MDRIVPIWLQQWSVLTLGFCVGRLLGLACSLGSRSPELTLCVFGQWCPHLQVGDMTSVRGVDGPGRSPWAAGCPWPPAPSLLASGAHSQGRGPVGHECSSTCQVLLSPHWQAHQTVEGCPWAAFHLWSAQGYLLAAGNAASCAPIVQVHSVVIHLDFQHSQAF